MAAVEGVPADEDGADESESERRIGRAENGELASSAGLPTATAVTDGSGSASESDDGRFRGEPPRRFGLGSGAMSSSSSSSSTSTPRSIAPAAPTACTGALQLLRFPPRPRPIMGDENAGTDGDVGVRTPPT